MSVCLDSIHTENSVWNLTSSVVRMRYDDLSQSFCIHRTVQVRFSLSCDVQCPAKNFRQFRHVVWINCNEKTLTRKKKFNINVRFKINYTTKRRIRWYCECVNEWKCVFSIEFSLNVWLPSSRRFIRFFFFLLLSEGPLGGLFGDNLLVLLRCLEETSAENPGISVYSLYCIEMNSSFNLFSYLNVSNAIDFN